ncbi:MAG: M15 family metallopeptidase [Clostridia bacterium]|nr:M15 family metallopeptidase [Clostridia bacterium]
MKKKNDNRRKIISVCLFSAVAAVLFFVAAVICFSDLSEHPFGDEKITAEATVGEADKTESNTSKNNTEETTAEKVTEHITETSRINEETGRIIVNPEQELWNLVVVNMGREMPSGYKPELAEILSTGIYMDKRVVPFYEQMYLDAKKDGIILTPYSGYRSYERQERNYKNLTETYMSDYGLSRKEAAKKAAMVILPPGTSEHNLGLAMDICNTKDSFAFTEEYKWLTENAHKYGFILRYTEEKIDITGIVDEPWHWRYVGTEYAEDIKNSGLCLEEYLQMKGIDF